MANFGDQNQKPKTFGGAPKTFGTAKKFGNKNGESFDVDGRRALTDAEKAVREAMDATVQRYRAEVCNDYYTVLVFQNNEQAEAFRKALYAKGMKHEIHPLYTNGVNAAKALGIPLPSAVEIQPRKPKAKLAEIARPVPGGMKAPVDVDNDLDEDDGRDEAQSEMREDNGGPGDDVDEA